LHDGSTRPALSIQVSGPVRAWSGGRALPLGWPRQRAVLAMLALRGSHGAAKRELVDALWGAEPPASASNNVHSYVANLRRILEPDRRRRSPEEILALDGARYVLRLHPGQLDATEFTDRVIRANTLLADGDRAGAADLFGIALEQSSPFPLADVPGLFAEQVRAGLVEQRLAAYERWTETLLRWAAVSTSRS